MRLWFNRLFLNLPLLACLLVCSCNNENTTGVSEEEMSAYKSAMTLKNGDGDKKALALKDFLSVINQRTDAPKSHLEVGLLYLDPAVGDPDPFSAIYHFKKYLDYVPDPKSDQARRVQGQIKRAKLVVTAQLPGDPYQTKGDSSLHLEELKRLRDENQQLRARLQQLTNRTEEFTLQDTPAEPSRPQVRTYKVRTGDTLFKIASSVYGDPSRWREIYEANRAPRRNENPMRNENDLKPGQELFIP